MPTRSTPTPTSARGARSATCSAVSRGSDERPPAGEDGPMDIAIAGGTGVIGSHVVRVAQERGHAVRVLSRGSGVDVLAGVGLENALGGADAVIDVLNITTTDADKATEFFRRTTANLLSGQRRDGA